MQTDQNLLFDTTHQLCQDSTQKEWVPKNAIANTLLWEAAMGHKISKKAMKKTVQRKWKGGTGARAGCGCPSVGRCGLYTRSMSSPRPPSAPGGCPWEQGACTMPGKCSVPVLLSHFFFPVIICQYTYLGKWKIFSHRCLNAREEASKQTPWDSCQTQMGWQTWIYYVIAVFDPFCNIFLQVFLLTSNCSDFVWKVTPK